MHAADLGVGTAAHRHTGILQPAPVRGVEPQSRQLSGLLVVRGGWPGVHVSNGQQVGAGDGDRPRLWVSASIRNGDGKPAATVLTRC